MTATDLVSSARSAGRTARRALTGPERAAANEAIHHRLLGVPALCSPAVREQRAAPEPPVVHEPSPVDEPSPFDTSTPTPAGTGLPPRIALYAPVDGEVDVTTIAAALRDRGCSVWLPVVGDDDTMRFREWRPDDALVAGRFGIDQPPDDGRASVDSSGFTVVVAPCTAVDVAGTRIGFGRGYYDRALGPAVPRPTVVVAAFDAQVVEHPLPRRGWDVPADIIVTDRRTILLAG